MAEDRVLSLEPYIDERWEAEALLHGQLGTDLERTDADTARKWLDRVTLKLPERVSHQELLSFAAAKGMPLDVGVVPDVERFDFHFFALPLNVLIPAAGVDEGRRMVRLRMAATLDADGGVATAYDLFPRDDYVTITRDFGAVSVDVTKALAFVAPVVAGVLGLDLKVPLKWKSTKVLVRTSDLGSNPVEWDVTDEAIDNGFTGYVIAQVPKGAPLAVDVEVVCEFRKASLAGRMQQATYRSGVARYDFSF